ncbi:MAG: 2-hydroxyacyl-CoA dehydratase family protein [Desulfobacterales bacterium]|jgi:benzoyl-CoA reductase/2-hydroxyglutaryl-CoA dehydratase subunit BcrC/BadD/HgdB
MMAAFQEAARTIACQPILEWKEKGNKVVGHTCSHVPGEIFHAAGILPVRLRGIGTERMQIGDAYFGPYICSFPKCILQLAGEGGYAFLDGAIITPGCDSMRRLDECWRKAGDDHPGIVPDFFYYFDVPHKTAPHGLAWFEEEIRNLMGAVEAHFQVRISAPKLQAAIRLFNRGRRLLARLAILRADDRRGVSGSEAFAATVAGAVMPRERYNGLLARWLEEIATRPDRDPPEGRKRLMVIGSISDDMDLIRLIEADGRAVVAAENLCFGVRFAGHAIEENGDPIAALARGYLGRSICPRMYGKYKERLAAIREAIVHAHIDGVLMQNIRFCDLHGSENGLFERDLEAQGIPCLRIEREYGPLVETGRVRMRLDAFLERLTG